MLFLLQFTMLQKPEKSFHLSKQSNRKLNSVNMPSKIDIDALKFKKKSRTNGTEKRKKIKNSQSQLKIDWFWKRRMYFDFLIFEKNFWNPKLLY